MLKTLIKRLRCLGLGLTMLALTLPAAAHERPAMRFDHLTVADGLAQSSVMDVVQDEQGFIWFATENGLDRFDGIRFRNYRLERGQEGTLANNFIRDLELAPDGSLWVATDGGGVSRWDPQTDRFTTWRHDAADSKTLSSDRIRTLAAAADGTIWIGTRENGLDRLDPKTGEFVHLAHDPDNPGSLSNNEVFDIAIAPDGALWIGTLSGLNRIDPESLEIERFTDELVGMPGTEDDYIRTLTFDADGLLWIGTHDAGLCTLNIETREVTQNVADPDVPESLPGNQINALYIDSADRLWIGTEAGLSLRLPNHDTFQTFAHDGSDPLTLGDNGVFSIFQDRGDVLWVGTRIGGVSKWNPRSWSFGHVSLETASADGGAANITAFTKPAEDEVWVGTFGDGILVADGYGDIVRRIVHDPENPESLGDDRVMTLMTDAGGSVWAGTMRSGLNRIDPVTGLVERFVNDPEDPASLAANGVMSLLEASTGHIWVGTFGGGVSRLDRETGRFDNFSHVPGDETTLNNPRATSLAESPTGIVFVGTDGGGLNVFDPETSNWQAMQHDPANAASLSSNTVYALHFDANGRLWVASRAGIDLLVPDRRSDYGYSVTPLRGAAKLPRSDVFGVQSDTNGSIWLSTTNGLVSLQPEGGTVRNFHTEHGLQGEEFNFGASYRAPDGTIFFGGSGGYNRFQAENLEFNKMPPPIVLTGLSVMNEPVDWAVATDVTRALELGYSDNIVTFDVAALDYAAPEKNLYAYRLDGFDARWNDLGNDRRITYTNLDGGDYTLRVKASNSDGVWNESSFSIPVSVAHPPWRTWWAYLGYLLAVALVVFYFWNRQQQKLRREFEYSRRLEHEVKERTKLLDRRNSELKDLNSKLVEASTTDALTGLRNRRFLYENIEKDVELVLRHYRDGTRTLAPGGNNDLLFLMVDLDNFKPVNDSCGHEAGDALLVQVRDVLLDCCRASDDVIRWGGDEFLIIARDTNRKFAATLADRIRTSLGERVFRVGEGQVARITTSIGYATFPFIKDRPDLLGWEEVLGIADAAMYESKQKRNAWMGIEGIEWEGTGADLYQAIKSTPGELAEDGNIRALESIECAEEASA